MHRVHDIEIARAATQVALKALGDFFLAGIGVFGDQVHTGHDHAWGTKPALQGMALGEGFLHRMQVPLGQALHGGDLGALELNGQHGTRLDGVAIHNDCAAAALAGVAADMGASQATVIAQKFDQQRSRLDLMGLKVSVDGEGDSGHGEALSVRGRLRARGLSLAYLVSPHFTTSIGLVSCLATVGP